MLTVNLFEFCISYNHKLIDLRDLTGPLIYIRSAKSFRNQNCSFKFSSWCTVHIKNLIPGKSEIVLPPL